MEKFSYSYLIRLVSLCAFFLVIGITFASFTPRQFPVGTQVHIAKNMSLSEIATTLSSKHVIASPFLFKVAVTIVHGQGKIAAGDYLFDAPQNLWAVIGRLVKGEQGLTAIKVTIPEGSTIADIAGLLQKKIPDFNAPYFIKIASTSEGYLFPDTYRFYPNTTATEILSTLRKNFDLKFQNLLLSATLSGRKTTDIVTMASIIEKEASVAADRAIISGILWKRIDEGIPLQVDATIVYLTGHAPVSIEDTKINSPYNTYKNKGLPKGPIANPGIDALRAALNPAKSPYYFYLSDLKGDMHYAATHDGHIINRERYLNK